MNSSSWNRQQAFLVLPELTLHVEAYTCEMKAVLQEQQTLTCGVQAAVTGNKLCRLTLKGHQHRSETICLSALFGRYQTECRKISASFEGISLSQASVESFSVTDVLSESTRSFTLCLAGNLETEEEDA